MRDPWFRLCIDVDHAGNVVGSSYEVHQYERIVAVHAMAAPGPFDTPQETMSGLQADLLDRYGTQLRFF